MTGTSRAELLCHHALNQHRGTARAVHKSPRISDGLTLRQAVNDPVVQAAVEDDVKLRVDITVVETDIHHPTDNILLWDVGRVVNPVNCREIASASLRLRSQTTHIECFHGSAEALEAQFLREFDVRALFDGVEHVDIDQDLSVPCFIAEPGGEVCHVARH